ncbi:MAG: flavodoxin family protein, partial [Promethearchaeota archaeon]
KMKILVAYFTNTGNTEKVAKAIYEALVEEQQDVTLLTIKECDPGALNSYDLIIFGSGIYAETISKKIVRLVKKATELPAKIAGFHTYGRPKIYKGVFNNALGEILTKHNSKLIAESGCMGENKGMTREQSLQWISGMPEEEQEEARKNMDNAVGHPDKEDLENAKKFAKSLLEI